MKWVGKPSQKSPRHGYRGRKPREESDQLISGIGVLCLGLDAGRGTWMLSCKPKVVSDVEPL